MASVFCRNIAVGRIAGWRAGVSHACRPTGATVLQTDRAGPPLGGILLFTPRFIADVLGLLVSLQRLHVARKPRPAHGHAPAFQRCHSVTTSIALLQSRVLVRPHP